ncbi:glycosyltransferase family 4 protein [Halobacterium salinarum]|uniref:glycosyltransferase family 4 protein n=1 Tax=Halobacterium salinarum TaxID=2242 RepID=UPI002552CF4B|nr:glycosyltransferase family 4 protein [Halobacterium salinarum]MDL0145387.1 glycosyltransferase family 4 protein [Halobacterium salinarum]
MVKYQVKVLRKFSELDLDVLYCNNLRSLLLFGPSANLLGIPVIWYVRTDIPTPLLDKVGFYFADEIITISDGVRDRFSDSTIDAYDDHIRTIYTGLDLSKFDPETSYNPIKSIDTSILTIVEVATLHPNKGQEKILEALSDCGDSLPDYQLLFAGTTTKGQEDYKEKLTNLAEEYNIQENVEFLGWCDNISALLSKSDIFVLPSENEGLPRSILEASAMKIPTIATPAGGTEELVQSGVTGIITPQGDVDALSDAIQELANDPAKRTSFGENARELVENRFSKNRYVSEFESLLASLS